MLKKLTNITIGADIELFLQDKATKEIISAEGYIRGEKMMPFNFDPANEYFATTLDNVLAEFSIPPARSKEEFYAFIQKSLGYINDNIPKEYCTIAIPSANLHPRFLETDQAKIFGCEPDFNAYTGDRNARPEAEDETLRSAGGHIHIGYEGAPEMTTKRSYKGDPERCGIIKAMDLFVGVPSLLMEPDNKRRELYGKAGCFRPKAYGVEYRTISNFYLASEELTKWAYDATMNALDWLNAGNEVDEHLGNYINKTINFADKDQAKNLIDEFGLKLAA